MRKDMDIAGIEKSNIHTIKILYNKTRKFFSHLFSSIRDVFLLSCFIALHKRGWGGKIK